MSCRVHAPLVLLAVALFLFASSLTGCTKSLNNTVPSLIAADGEASSLLNSGTTASPAVGSTHQRDDWPRLVILAPRATVEVQPDYINEYMLPARTARGRGEYPTADSVFDEDRDHTAALVEGLLSPPHAIGSILLIPFQMVLCQRWPCEVEFEPRPTYARTPTPGMADVETEANIDANSEE